MLKQISLNEVIIPIQQNRKREFEIFDNKQTALPNMDTMEDIIEKNIQIQYALMPFYENRAEKRSPVYQNINCRNSNKQAFRRRSSSISKPS